MPSDFGNLVQVVTTRWLSSQQQQQQQPRFRESMAAVLRQVIEKWTSAPVQSRDAEIRRFILAALAGFLVLLLVLWPRKHTQRQDASKSIRGSSVSATAAAADDDVADATPSEDGSAFVSEDSSSSDEEDQQQSPQSIGGPTKKHAPRTSSPLLGSQSTMTFRSASPMGSTTTHFAASSATGKKGQQQRRRKSSGRLLGVSGPSGADIPGKEAKVDEDADDSGSVASSSATTTASQRSAKPKNSIARKGRPRVKRRVGSIMDVASVGPAPIPERNSSYHKLASLPEPDPVLLGTSARDAPPSILRKDVQFFPGRRMPMGSHAHVPRGAEAAYLYGDDQQEAPPTPPTVSRSRLIKLTEPDWDSYADTHERARQRIEVRELASRGLARARSEPALKVQYEREDEPLGSWLAYAPIHSPQQISADAGNGSPQLQPQPQLPAFTWFEDSTDADASQQEFWFERFTSSTAAAGRDWDWRKRRARERKQQQEQLAASIEQPSGTASPHLNGSHSFNGQGQRFQSPISV